MEADSAAVDNDALAATRVVLRPIASPFALGFLGLAGDTLTLAGMELGWIPGSERFHVALIAVTFAPALQLLACIFGFLARDAVAATGMGVIAATWEVIGLVTLTSDPGSTSAALGTLLLLSGVALMLSSISAAHSKLVPAAVMFTTATRFTVTGIYEFVGGHAWLYASGIVGCVLGAVAVYGAIALELEDLRHHAVLPTLRHGKGAAAMQGGLARQVDQVSTEAGVRRQL